MALELGETAAPEKSDSLCASCDKPLPKGRRDLLIIVAGG
jgi:hypothetical protein